MPFGQSYFAYKAFSALGRGLARLGGDSPEEAEKFGKIYGATIAGAIAVVTLDPAGGAATAADAASDPPSPSP